jgi:hypothetical protein
MRELLARIILWRFELRVKRTDPMRHFTEEDWALCVERGWLTNEGGLHIPRSAMWQMKEPNPTRIQSIRMVVARKILPC